MIRSDIFIVVAAVFAQAEPVRLGPDNFVVLGLAFSPLADAGRKRQPCEARRGVCVLIPDFHSFSLLSLMVEQ